MICEIWDKRGYNSTYDLKVFMHPSIIKNCLSRCNTQPVNIKVHNKSSTAVNETLFKGSKLEK